MPTANLAERCLQGSVKLSDAHRSGNHSRGKAKGNVVPPVKEEPTALVSADQLAKEAIKSSVHVHVNGGKTKVLYQGGQKQRRRAYQE